MTLPLEIAQKYYTVEEFMSLPLDSDKRYELVRGEIREMSHPGEEHTVILDNLYWALGNYVRDKRLGRALPGAGYKLTIPEALRETMRVPDLAVLAKEYISGQPKAVLFTPELAVEIYSPNDKPGELKEKLQDYQQAGWGVVWVIYPPSASPKRKAGTVELYRLQDETGLQPAAILKQPEILLGEGMLEGFSITVTALFDYNM